MNGFDRIIGNDHVKEFFSEALKNDSLSHAYIISGEKGTGKKTMAQTLILNLFCKKKENGIPCLKCSECRKILSENHSDVFYVRSEKKSLGVARIREELVDDILIKPFEAEKKVYIVEAAHTMTQEAQNALLKTLEEPPSYALLLLLAEDEKALLDTVRSRAVSIKMKPVNDRQMRDFFKNTENADAKDIETVIAFSRGNIGRAKEIINDESIREMYSDALDLCKNIKNMRAVFISEAVKKFSEKKFKAEDIIDAAQLWYRDIFLYKASRNTDGILFKKEKAAIIKLAEELSFEALESIMAYTQEAWDRIAANVNGELVLEMMFIKTGRRISGNV